MTDGRAKAAYGSGVVKYVQFNGTYGNFDAGQMTVSSFEFQYTRCLSITMKQVILTLMMDDIVSSLDSLKLLVLLHSFLC